MTVDGIKKLSGCRLCAKRKFRASCELSIEGYSLFNQNQTPYLYVYLENAENAEKITKEYKSDYSALVADN